MVKLNLLNSLLADVEKTAVSIDFLEERAPDGVGVLLYQELRRFSRSSLFKKYKAVIVLIPHKVLKKGHYIALIPHKNHIEYFSSLGMSPHSELVKLKQEQNIISNVLGSDFVYNRRALQNTHDYNVNTCGAFVYLRTKFYEMSLQQFQKLFTPVSLHNPDEIASMLVLSAWI